MNKVKVSTYSKSHYVESRYQLHLETMIWFLTNFSFNSKSSYTRTRSELCQNIQICLLMLISLQIAKYLIVQWAVKILMVCTKEISNFLIKRFTRKVFKKFFFFKLLNRVSHPKARSLTQFSFLSAQFDSERTTLHQELL